MGKIHGTVPAQRETREGTGEKFMVQPDLYYLQLISVEEADNSNSNPEWGNSWEWKFLVSDRNGRVVTSKTMGPDGRPQPLLMRQFSSDKMGSNPKGVKAKGRQWFEALLRRPLRDNEDLGEVADAAVGEVAGGMLCVQTAKTTGTEYCAIAQMIPADAETVAKVQERKRQLAESQPDTDDVPF